MTRSNRELQRYADRMAVELQRVVAAIRTDYPAAASTVDDASTLLGVIAGRLPVP